MVLFFLIGIVMIILYLAYFSQQTQQIEQQTNPSSQEKEKKDAIKFQESLNLQIDSIVRSCLYEVAYSGGTMEEIPAIWYAYTGNTKDDEINTFHLNNILAVCIKSKILKMRNVVITDYSQFLDDSEFKVTLSVISEGKDFTINVRERTSILKMWTLAQEFISHYISNRKIFTDFSKYISKDDRIPDFLIDESVGSLWCGTDTTKKTDLLSIENALRENVLYYVASVGDEFIKDFSYDPKKVFISVSCPFGSCQQDSIAMANKESMCDNGKSVCCVQEGDIVVADTSYAISYTFQVEFEDIDPVYPDLIVPGASEQFLSRLKLRFQIRDSWYSHIMGKEALALVKAFEKKSQACVLLVKIDKTLIDEKPAIIYKNRFFLPQKSQFELPYLCDAVDTSFTFITGDIKQKYDFADKKTLTISLPEQGTMKGSVSSEFNQDDNKIIFYSLDVSDLYYGVTTDDNGHFIIQNAYLGSYLCVISKKNDQNIVKALTITFDGKEDVTIE